MPTLRLALTLVLLASGLIARAAAQSPASEPRPSFEVASVRPNTSGDTKMSARILPGGRYEAINIPLRNLIVNSYSLQSQQLVGAPDWISSARFDIVAKADGELGPPVSREGPSRLQLMIRSLLEERFKLKVHREPRQVDVYALVLARADGRLGPELRPSSTNCEALMAARGKGGPAPEPPSTGDRPQCGARVLAGELIAGGRPLGELVSLLSATVGRSVIDRTGLSGAHDMHLKWAPDLDPNGPSIFTALQEQLGLKLQSERGTIDALVIDSIERPTPD